MPALAWALAAALAAGATSDRHVAWFPAQLAGATRAGTPAVYDKQTIFDYMDGKGEVYLTYAYQQVTVAAYKLGDKDVEAMIFDMSTPAEAFGVWSLDLDGQRAGVLQDSRFNEGMLRGWQGSLFVKIDGDPDTPGLKDFAVALAKAIGARIDLGPALPPPLCRSLPAAALRLKNCRFFHRFDNLALFYYLSTQDVLELGPDTSAAFAEGSLDGKPLKVLLINYAAAAARDKAFETSLAKIFSNKATKDADGDPCEELDPGKFSGLRKVAGPGGEPRLAWCLEADTLPHCAAGLAALAKAAAGAPAAESAKP
jgi:hypothetical protein